MARKNTPTQASPAPSPPNLIGDQLLSREQLIKAAALVERATQELKIAARSEGVELTLEKVKTLVEQGASAKEFPGAYHCAMKQDNSAMLNVLVEAAGWMDQVNKKSLVSQAARLGAEKSMRLLIEKGFHLGADIQEGDNKHHSVFDAVRYDQVSIAKMLIENGANTESADHFMGGLTSACRSVEMFRMLREKNFPINTRELVSACFHENKVNLDLLDAFLKEGCPTEQEKGPIALSVLLRNTDNIVAEPDKHAEAARMLLEQGAILPEKHSDMQLPAIHCLFKAGMPRDQLEPMLVNFEKTGSARLVMDPEKYFDRKHPDYRNTKAVIQLATHMLTEIADGWPDLDLAGLYRQNRDTNWKTALIQAGADPGEEQWMAPPEAFAMGLAARMRRQTAPAPTSTRTGMRL